MNIKDSYVHVGPSGDNAKALLKHFEITASQITLTRAISNDAGTGDKTETYDIPTWNQDTTGNADTASALSVIKSTAATAHYLTFVNSNNDSAVNENFYTTAKISIIPSTGRLTMNDMNGGLRWNVDYLSSWARDFIYFQQHTNSNSSDALSTVFRIGSYGDPDGYVYTYIGGNNYDGSNLRFNKDGSITIGTNKVWHAGNDGPNSGLNADLLDGQHLSDLDARYVLISGDTMTGALTVPSLSVTGAATFSQAINGSILGNAATASRLQNARTISLTGSVTGSGTFDGSGNLSIATTTNHSHSQYLPLAGGTMTGDITMTSGKSIILTNYTTASSFGSTDRAIPFSITDQPSKIAWTCTDSNLGLTFNPNTGALKSGSFVKRGGTSSQFLKADGSVDSNSYLISSTNVTTATWTAKTDNVNYPIAFSPNATPATSGNGYNSGFTFNPGTMTLSFTKSSTSCRQQYDSTNKVLKFIFD